MSHIHKHKKQKSHGFNRVPVYTGIELWAAPAPVVKNSPCAVAIAMKGDIEHLIKSVAAGCVDHWLSVVS